VAYVTRVFHRRPWRATAFAVAAVSVCAMTLGFSQDASATPAGVQSFAIAGIQPVVAVADARVFDYSDTPGDDVVHVYTLSGAAVATIPDEPDVISMTSSADGTRLYVGLGDANQISVIDTDGIGVSRT
jgi:hypothetical protein